MGTQPLNAFTKDQLQEVLKQIQMLETAEATLITALDIQFDSQHKGRLSKPNGEWVFTPTLIQPQSGSYFDR